MKPIMDKIFYVPEQFLRGTGGGKLTGRSLFQWYVEGLNGNIDYEQYRKIVPREVTNKQIAELIHNPNPDPAPCILTMDGMFVLFGGHHRCTRLLAMGEKTIPVRLHLISPFWLELSDQITKVYSYNREYLYQEIEHPWFANWSVHRKKFRVNAIYDKVKDIQKSESLTLRRYLDIASSTGAFTRKFAQGGFQTYGIDSNKEAVCVAEKLNYVFQPMRINPTYLCTNKFDQYLSILKWDVISCLSLLNHWFEAGRYDEVIAMIKKLSDHCQIFIFDLPGDDRITDEKVPKIPSDIESWLVNITHKCVAFVGTFEGRHTFLIYQKVS